jgi:hypothetical protein
MNIYLVMSLLAIVCIPFIFSNIDYSIAFLSRVILLISNNVTESLHIPAAFGDTTNDLQKQDIKDITGDNSSNNSVIRVISNNADYKKEGTNQNWNINFISILIDSVSSVYRMFVALGLSVVAAIIIGITAARKPLASKIIIPIIDILQSIPILGFFLQQLHFLLHCLMVA